MKRSRMAFERLGAVRTFSEARFGGFALGSGLSYGQTSNSGALPVIGTPWVNARPQAPFALKSYQTSSTRSAAGPGV